MTTSSASQSPLLAQNILASISVDARVNEDVNPNYPFTLSILESREHNFTRATRATRFSINPSSDSFIMSLPVPRLTRTSSFEFKSQLQSGEECIHQIAIQHIFEGRTNQHKQRYKVNSLNFELTLREEGEFTFLDNQTPIAQDNKKLCFKASVNFVPTKEFEEEVEESGHFEILDLKDTLSIETGVKLSTNSSNRGSNSSLGGGGAGRSSNPHRENPLPSNDTTILPNSNFRQRTLREEQLTTYGSLALPFKRKKSEDSSGL